VCGAATMPCNKSCSSRPVTLEVGVCRQPAAPRRRQRREEPGRTGGDCALLLLGISPPYFTCQGPPPKNTTRPRRIPRPCGRLPSPRGRLQAARGTGARLPSSFCRCALYLSTFFSAEILRTRFSTQNFRPHSLRACVLPRWLLCERRAVRRVMQASPAAQRGNRGRAAGK
jgi:hypothetical protein